jgi:DNA-binding NarL/FixJ family response regulator
VAHEYLASAETTARREHLPLELAETLAARAELALAQPGASKAQAQQLATEAAQIMEQGRNGLRARAFRALAAQAAGHAALPAGLSQRELEVLRLVALGQTNRQIAQSLTITEKTVEKHLSAILGKTGVENRTGATAFAYQHHLVSPRTG